MIHMIDPKRLMHLVVPELAVLVPSSPPTGGGGGGGGVSGAPVDVSCARNRVDIGTTDVACASNRVSVRDAKGLPRPSQTLVQSFIPLSRVYIMGVAFVRGCPTRHDDTCGLVGHASLANSALRRDYDNTAKDFRRNTIHIISGDGIISLSEVSFYWTEGQRDRERRWVRDHLGKRKGTADGVCDSG